MLLIDEPTPGVDATTAAHLFMAVRRRRPRPVFILVMHDLPADRDLLGSAWSIVSLDEQQTPEPQDIVAVASA